VMEEGIGKEEYVAQREILSGVRLERLRPPVLSNRRF
jgi:hypothetical protein